MKQNHTYDMEDSIEGYRQIEVSHGSTSNQTSMYASSSTANHRSCRFCCDIILVVFLLAAIVFVMLFWYDHVPCLASYFQNHQHRRDKIIIAVFAIFLIFLVFVILMVRWIRGRYPSCHRQAELIWYKRKRAIPKPASILDEEESQENPGYAPHRKDNINSKLNELSESELHDLRRILVDFLNYHDGNDWSFAPSSTSSRKKTLGSSPINSLYTPKIQFTVKIVLVGSPNVGKTSIFHRILYDRFTEYYMATLGADIGHNTLHLFPSELNNYVMISLQLWDIAGSERFSELAHIVYKDATAFIVVCDVTSPTCSTVAIPWIKDLKGVMYEPYVALLFNKIDLHKKMTTIDEFEQEMSKFDSFSVSAKTGENVLENMVELIARAVKHELEKLL